MTIPMPDRSDEVPPPPPLQDDPSIGEWFGREPGAMSVTLDLQAVLDDIVGDRHTIAYHRVARIVEQAAPLIERQVRERIAADIKLLDGLQGPREFWVRDRAARIARGAP